MKIKSSAAGLIIATAMILAVGPTKQHVIRINRDGTWFQKVWY